MATSKSRRKKRRKRRSARLPAVALVVLMVGVGGLLVVSARDSTPDEAVPVSDATEPTVGSTPSSNAITSSTEPSIVTIGSVAPPVSIDTDDEGDGDEGLVLDDFTPTETPQPPSSPLTVPASAITNGAVGRPLADGDYLGYLDRVASDDSIVVRFDDASGPVFEVSIQDLLFVSLRVDARDPSHPGSAVVSARTLNRLLTQGDPTYTIPDTDDLVLVDGTFLITIAEGRVVGVEGLG